MVPATSTGIVPVRSETRAPYTTRLKTERPNSSVPNQCSAEGGCRRARRFCLAGGASAMTGARTATSTSASTSTRPNTAMRFRKKRRTAGERRKPVRTSGTARASAIADPRVEQGIGEVHQQVHDDEDHGDEQHGALHQRGVLRADGVHYQPPDAGPGEDRLRENGAAQQAAELQADDRDYGQHGVP